jgi:hypothetical protein
MDLGRCTVNVKYLGGEMMRMKKILLVAIVSMFAIFSTVSSIFAQEMDSDATISFRGGSLTLDVVPTVDFGEQTIVAEEVTYQSETTDPYVQVTDNRGTGTGWSVSAVMSPFTAGEEGEETLPGALLTFSGGVVGSESNSADPVANSSIELHPGGDSTNVVTAEENQGLGLWVTSWSPTEESGLNDNVTLNIPPGSATTGTHTAAITWTLTSAPGQ